MTTFRAFLNEHLSDDTATGDVARDFAADQCSIGLHSPPALLDHVLFGDFQQHHGGPSSRSFARAFLEAVEEFALSRIAPIDPAQRPGNHRRADHGR